MERLSSWSDVTLPNWRRAAAPRFPLFFEQRQVMAHLLLQLALVFGAMEEKPDAAQQFPHEFRPAR